MADARMAADGAVVADGAVADAEAAAADERDGSAVDARTAMSAVEAGTDAASKDAAVDGSLPRDADAPMGADPSICPTEQRDTCAFYTPRGLVYVGYGMTPPPESYTYPVRLKVLKRYPAMLLQATGENVTRFDVTSSPPQTAKEELGLSHGPPGTFLHEPLPAELIYDHGGGYTDCFKGPSPGGAEPIALGYNSLRATNGELLIQSTSALIRPNGVVEPVEGQDDPRAYDLRWVDAGCAPCGPRALRTVAIEVTMKGESVPLFSLLPGERKRLRIDGVDYTFRLNSASAHPDPTYCGESGWVVYRSDLVSGE